MTRLTEALSDTVSNCSSLTDDEVAQRLRAALDLHKPGQLFGSQDDGNPLGHPALPGYCYLVLFEPDVRAAEARIIGKYPVRSRVEARAQDSAAHVSKGYFRVTFGTPEGAKLSQKFQAHVEEVPAGHSLLRARDVLHVMPFGSRFGDGTLAPEPATSAPDPTLSVPSVPSYLGGVPDPTRRRFFYTMWTLDSAQAPGNWVAGALDPMLGTAVAQFTAFSQFAALESLSVHLIPALAAIDAQVTVQCAWYPTSETAPNDQASFNRAPTHTVHALAPVYPGGRVDTLKLECPMAYGISRVVKPPPHFGGSPRFAWRCQTTALPGATVGPSTVLYRIYVEAVVSTRMA
jgi:hypothetical protein